MSNPYKYSTRYTFGQWQVYDVNGKPDGWLSVHEHECDADTVVNALQAEYNRGTKDGADEAYEDGLEDGRLEACGESPLSDRNKDIWGDDDDRR